MNFVLVVVGQYILAVRIVVIQAGLLLLDWKAVLSSKQLYEIPTPFSSEQREKTQPPLFSIQVSSPAV